MFSLEERYIISKLNSTIEEVTELFEKYKLNEVPIKIEELFLELSRTYIQLTRDKSAVGKDEDKKLVLFVIYKVLMGAVKMLAPIAPFVTEGIYQDLKKSFGVKTESIHLFDWPSAETKLIDHDLEKSFELIANIVQSALSAREKVNLGIRWPLKEVVIVSKGKSIVKAVEMLGDIIKTQLNVKEIKVLQEMPGVKTTVKVDYKQIGPDFKQDAPKVISKLATESAETILGHIEKEGKYELRVGKEKFNIVKEYLIVQREVPSQFQEAEIRSGFIYLNKEMTDELEAEGFSREVMRRVQNLRKKAGLKKLDRISLYIKGDDELVEMLKVWEEQIKEKVGADQLKISSLDSSKKHKNVSKEKVKGKSFEIGF